MTAATAEEVLRRLRTVLPPGRSVLHEPDLGGRELEYVQECVETAWVSSVGRFVERFEADLAVFTGAAAAVACVNGTAALQVALQLVGVQPGDEVLIPTLTFVGTANAVAHAGAVPHLVDSEERTLGLDPAALAEHLDAVAEASADGPVNRMTGRRLAAVVPVHIFGHPVDMPALVELCERWRLPLVEDAAESLGSSLDGRHTGRFGRIGVLSFNGNKVVTTGGGGALIADDPALAARAKHLTTTAKLPHAWEFRHDAVAWNFRMPNINAALGCGQLERLPGFLTAKRELAERYADAFRGLDGVTLVRERPGTVSNYWLQALLLDVGHEHLRDEVLSATNDDGVMTRPAWTPMHQLPMFQDAPRAPLDVAESLAARLVNVPSSPSIVTTGA